MQNCARTSPPHFHTLPLTLHPLTHSYLLSCISVSYKAIYLSASPFCVFCTLHFYIYTSPSQFFFLFEALWFKQRQSTERQVSSLFTAESSSILIALLIFGSLWYFHLLWPHHGCQSRVTVPVGGRVHCKERTSGRVCRHWETSSHAFCVVCEVTESLNVSFCVRGHCQLTRGYRWVAFVWRIEIFWDIQDH